MFSSKLSFSGSQSQEEYKLEESQSNSESENTNGLESFEVKQIIEPYVKDTADTCRNLEHDHDNLDNDIENYQSTIPDHRAIKTRKRDAKMKTKRNCTRSNFYIDLLDHSNDRKSLNSESN